MENLTPDPPPDTLLSSLRQRATAAARLSDEALQQAAQWARSEHVGTAAYGRHVLIEAGLRVVLQNADHYQHRAPMEQLLRSGLAGLDGAAARFEPGRGFRFSTFATWWIRQAITTDLRR
ncbi:MAG: sigma factor [Acidimicrobiales bacterium]